MVDDERQVRDLCTRILRISQYEVVPASSGEEAHYALEKHEFDVAIVDLRLLDMSGLDVLKDIKLKQPHCQVIILTGHGGYDTVSEAMKFGAYDYLQKPFDMGKLNMLVDRSMELVALRAKVARLEAEILRSGSPQ